MKTIHLSDGETYEMDNHNMGIFKLSDGHEVEFAGPHDVASFSGFIEDKTLLSPHGVIRFHQHVHWIRIAGTLEQYHAWRAARRIGAA